MKRTGYVVGLWIDQKKAIIVTEHQNGHQSVYRMESAVEGHYRLSGGARTASPWGPTDVAAEGKPERRRAHHLQTFYRHLMEWISGADSIYIFGPGEAKGEFVKEARKHKHYAEKIISVETTDKMTERQIGAHVREIFASRRQPMRIKQTRK